MAFLLGGVTMIMPVGSEAEASGKPHIKKHIKEFFENHVSNKDLEGDHQMLKEWIDKIEGDQATILANQVTILEKLNNLPSGGGGADDGNHTLRWDQNVLGAGRFVRVLVNAVNEPFAYMDKNTGLVWETAPGDINGDSLITEADKVNWSGARSHCLHQKDGGVSGWRLPSEVELLSLVDPSNPTGNPDLPAGHPFLEIQPGIYWSATTIADNSMVAWIVTFDENKVGDNTDVVNKENAVGFVWCVRGGHNDGSVY